jgi:uncharacterized protein
MSQGRGSMTRRSPRPSPTSPVPTPAVPSGPPKTGPDPPQFWSTRTEGVLVAIKVRPGARRAAIEGTLAAASLPGWPAGRLRVAVTEPAEGGRANEAMAAAVATALGVTPRDIAIVAGKTARDKLIMVHGRAEALAPLLTRLAG